MEALAISDVEYAQRLTERTLQAFSLHKAPILRQAAYRIVYPSALRLSRHLFEFDRVVGERNLWEATQLLLPNFINNINVQGEDRIPLEGPLLVTANHPGAADVLLLFSTVRRRDVRIVAGVEELRYLPNTWKRHIIYVDKSKFTRSGEVRETIVKFLQKGECILLFPRGKMEPDPRWLQGAEDSIRHWSRSLETFVSKVPDLQILPAAIGGVINPSVLKFPAFAMLGNHKRRQRAAIFTQIIGKMLRNEWFQVQAQVAFGDVLLSREVTAEDVLVAIRERAQTLFPNLKNEQFPLVQGVSGWW
jgi:hypothetical protein